jgi:hypothetical protein
MDGSESIFGGGPAQMRSNTTHGSYPAPPHLTPIRNTHVQGAPAVPNRDVGQAGGAPRVFHEDFSVKIKSFDPKEVDWYAYRTHFYGLADQAQWSDRTKATKLMAALQGSLAGVTAGLPCPVIFESLIGRVDGIYGLANAREDAVLKLQSCRLESGESVSLFAERVRQLIMRAYAMYTAVDREEQALRISASDAYKA